MIRRAAARMRLGRDAAPQAAFTVAAQPQCTMGSTRIDRQALFITSDSFRSRSSACAGSSCTPRQDTTPRASRRYPVLVLLAGAPGDETEWTSGGGSVEVLLDNLIASGRMTPAIVVMHASDVDTRAATRRGDDNLGQLEKILVDELVPLVRRRYPVRRMRVHGPSPVCRLAVSLACTLASDIQSCLGVSDRSAVRWCRGGPRGWPAIHGRAIWSCPGAPRHLKELQVDLDRVWHCRQRLPWRRAYLLSAWKRPRWRTRGESTNGAHQMPVFRRELVDLLQTLFR